MTHPTTVFIRPAPGLVIADPQTGDYLPEKGAIMPRSAFWLRRMKDGDVLEGPAATPVKPAKAAKAE
ncbi:MAG: DUF2635 domain-containing protein [Desulfovibrio sp.]|jgi:hypothetical protein|nr:DUF2635 domain-containing protein [Desulfovibrio sp.]